MAVEKFYNEEGKVGVLVSPGFGAGWSTWNPCPDVEFALMDKTLVQMALDNKSAEAVEEYLAKKFGDDNVGYLGGWEDVDVRFIYPGTEYIIEEYDGSESLVIRENVPWVTA